MSDGAAPPSLRRLLGSRGGLPGPGKACSWCRGTDHRLNGCEGYVAAVAAGKSIGERKTETELETLSAVRIGRELGMGNDNDQADRPRTRGDCIDGPRPCPWVSCKHHLFLDVNQRTGTVTFNFLDVEPGDMEESCALDVADRGGEVLETVGRMMQLTRERVRQIEGQALRRMNAAGIAIR